MNHQYKLLLELNYNLINHNIESYRRELKE